MFNSLCSINKLPSQGCNPCYKINCSPALAIDTYLWINGIYKYVMYFNANHEYKLFGTQIQIFLCKISTVFQVVQPQCDSCIPKKHGVIKNRIIRTIVTMEEKGVG